jgi:hypothetical protein
MVENAYDTVKQTATWITRASRLATEAHERFRMITSPPTSPPDSDRENLGKIGREGNGLYIVLHKSESAEPSILMRALVDFGIPNPKAEEVVKALTKKVNGGTNNAWTGEVVIYGPTELLCDLSPSVYYRYLTSPTQDLDERVDENFRRLCAHLRARELCASVKTHDQLRVEQRSSACISWIHAIANAADVLCEQGEDNSI